MLNSLKSNVYIRHIFGYANDYFTKEILRKGPSHNRLFFVDFMNVGK